MVKELTIIKIINFFSICNIIYRTPENYHKLNRLFPKDYDKKYTHPDLHTVIDNFYNK